MASREGGMEIEQLAVERPEALARVPWRGVVLDEAQADLALTPLQCLTERVLTLSGGRVSVLA